MTAEMPARHDREQRSPSETLVFDKQGFLDDFAKEAKRASQKATIHTTAMFIDADIVGEKVLSIFQNTLATNKSLRLDASSETTPGQIYTLPTLSRKMRRTLQHLKDDYENLMKKFKKADVDVEHVNPPKSKLTEMVPIKGRMHIKGSYIDNRGDTEGKESIFYLHTNNFKDEKTVELVVKFKGKAAETWIERFNEIFDNQPSTDQIYQITEDTYAFYDAGNKGQSRILDTGVDIINNSSEIRAWSWLKPDGKFAKALRKAHKRKAKVEVITSKIKPQRPILRSGETLIWAANQRIGTPSYSVTIDENNIIHAKGFIATVAKDMIIKTKDGEIILKKDIKVAFIGSHNNSIKGVKAGTQELQMFTTNAEIISELEERHKHDKLAAA
jgi:hypothetical protein